MESAGKGQQAVQSWPNRRSGILALVHQDIPLRVRDEQVARKLMSDIVQQREYEACGLLPSRALRDGAGKVMTEHLADFLSDLRARGRVT